MTRSGLSPTRNTASPIRSTTVASPSRQSDTAAPKRATRSAAAWSPCASVSAVNPARSTKQNAALPRIRCATEGPSEASRRTSSQSPLPTPNEQDERDARGTRCTRASAMAGTYDGGTGERLHLTSTLTGLPDPARPGTSWVSALEFVFPSCGDGTTGAAALGDPVRRAALADAPSRDRVGPSPHVVCLTREGRAGARR